MARPSFDRELASKVLALASRAGDDEAAKHFGISTRSVKRYRVRMASDPALAEAVTKKTAEFDQHAKGWAEDAAAFMSVAIRKLSQLVGQAGPKQMRDIVGAVKIVGELDITRKVLGTGDEQPGAGAEGSAAQAAAGHGAEGQASAQEDPLH